MNITANRMYGAWHQSALVVVPSAAAFGMRGLCTVDGAQTTDPKATKQGSRTWGPPIT